jgi:hypothetical protein
MRLSNLRATEAAHRKGDWRLAMPAVGLVHRQVNRGNWPWQGLGGKAIIVKNGEFRAG